MKKILILGTNTGAEEILIKCKNRNIYTIITDNVEVSRSPLKKKADEYWMISNRDVDALENRLRKFPVDAILAGVSELAYDTAIELSRRLGIPFFANEEGWKIARDKNLFKKMCARNNVLIPREYGEDFSFTDIEFPVIVKPSDSSGCRGISVCKDIEELEAGIAFAKSVSVNKQIVAEQFVVGNGSMALYYMKNGKAKFMYIVRAMHTPQGKPAGVRIDPSYMEKYKDTNLKIIKMLENEPFENGPVFLQFIEKNGDFYAFEMGYRVPGASLYKVEEKLWGYDMLDAMLDYALGVEADVDRFDNTVINENYVMLHLMGRGGTVASIEGYEDVISYDSVLWGKCLVKPGDIIPDNGTLQQAVAFILINEKTMGKAEKKIAEVLKDFRILDDAGCNMILDVVL